MAADIELSTTLLSFHNMHEHGELFVNLLRARRESFIVKNQWALPESEGLEYDQYDNPSSRWVAVHRGEEVLAGVRLTPTTAKCGMYSYMIRDAQLGLLPSISPELMVSEAPIDPDIWEASRIFVINDVPMRLRTHVQSMLMRGLIKAAVENGAKQLLALGPAVWSRWIGRLGYSADPAGPILQTDGWPTQVALMQLDDATMLLDEIGDLRQSRKESDTTAIIQRARLRKNLTPVRAAE